jgi:hypothetical protein
MTLSTVARGQTKSFDRCQQRRRQVLAATFDEDDGVTLDGDGNGVFMLIVGGVERGRGASKQTGGVSLSRARAAWGRGRESPRR